MSCERIVLTPDAVSLLDAAGESLWVARWADVRQVAAWKQDLWSVDRICLGFRVSGRADHFACHEEQGGWRELMGEVERRFGVSESAWWAAVAVPAFEERFTVIWSRLDP